MVKVLGVSLYSKDIPSSVNDVISVIEANTAKENKLISATGAHGIVTSKKDKAFKNILDNFYYNLPDGMPCVWVGRMKGAKEMKRCYGPDFFAALMQATSDKNIKHFFCGGKEGVADALKKACGEKFSNHNIVGTYSPPFREMTDEEMTALGNTIKASGANVVWIGLSTPKQEKFGTRLAKFTNVDFIITVGAAFDFHTGNVKQAPKWIQKSGLEWFFRMTMEPKRLFKRYVEIVPLFVFYNIGELFTGSAKE